MRLWASSISTTGNDMGRDCIPNVENDLSISRFRTFRNEIRSARPREFAIFKCFEGRGGRVCGSSTFGMSPVLSCHSSGTMTSMPSLPFVCASYSQKWLTVPPPRQVPSRTRGSRRNMSRSRRPHPPRRARSRAGSVRRSRRSTARRPYRWRRSTGRAKSCSCIPTFCK
jgi:hypothetical protein